MMEEDSHSFHPKVSPSGLGVPHHLPPPPHHLQMNCYCCCYLVVTGRIRESYIPNVDIFKALLKYSVHPGTYFVFKGHALLPPTKLAVNAINAGHHHRVLIPT